MEGWVAHVCGDGLSVGVEQDLCLYVLVCMYPLNYSFPVWHSRPLEHTIIKLTHIPVLHSPPAQRGGEDTGSLICDPHAVLTTVPLRALRLLYRNSTFMGSRKSQQLP